MDIVEFINEKTAKSGGFVVNIGAGTGIEYYDPCFYFYEIGYDGLAIDGANDLGLTKNLPAENISKLEGCFITPYNAADLLRQHATPLDFSFLKIDIDGYDSCILRSILNAGYRPKVIQIEINPEIPFPIEFSVMYDAEYRTTLRKPDPKPGTPDVVMTGFYGMSFAYAARIAKEFQYHIVCFDNIHHHDLILVDDRLSTLIGSNTSMTYNTLHQLYFDHPFPSSSHFLQDTDPPIDSLTWRYNTDMDALCREVWIACMQAAIFKHEGKFMPFHFSISPRNW